MPLTQQTFLPLLILFTILPYITSMEVYLHVYIYKQSAKIKTLTITGTTTRVINFNSYEINQSFEAVAGDHFDILFSSKSVKFLGTLIIEGYENPISNYDSKFWHDHNQDIYVIDTATDFYYYYLKNGGWDHLKFVVPTFSVISTVSDKGWGNYVYRFTCKSSSMEIDNGAQAQLPISSMIAKKKTQYITEPKEVNFYQNTNHKGTFSDNKGQTSPNKIFSCNPPSSVKYKTMASTNPYCEVLKFYSYDSTAKEKNTCNENAQLTIYVRGEGCSSTNKNCNNIACTACSSGNAFIESDRTHCVSSSSIQNGYYYNSTLDLFKLCYTTCATCNAYGDGDEHNCLTCKASYNNHYLITGTPNIKNCYSTSCFANGLFSKENTNECFVSCDPLTEYQYVTSSIKACYTSCEDEGLYYKEGTKECVSECSGTHPFLSNDRRTCLQECDDFYYVDNTLQICVEHCYDVDRYEYPSQKQCVTACTVSPYVYIDCEERTCVSDCNGDCAYVKKDGTKCVVSCEDGEYALDRKYCADDCDSNFPFKDDANKICLNDCGDKYKILNENICIEACNDVYKYEYIDSAGKKYCTDVCPDTHNLIGKDNRCYDICPQSFPYEVNGNCVEQCPDGLDYYREDNKTCLVSCESENIFIYGNTNICVTSCKDEYHLEIENQYQCVNTCPNGYKLYLEGGKCVQNCPSPYDYILPSNHQCVLQCSNSDTPYANPVTHYCMPNCYSDTTLNLYEDMATHSCVMECDFDTSYVIYETKQCVPTCQGTNYPFITNANDNTKECLQECSKHPYILIHNNTNDNQYECLQNCSDSIYGELYEYFGTCVSECPELMKLNNSKCTLDLEFGVLFNSILPSGYSSNRLNDVLNKVILPIKEMNQTIQGSDFILQVYPSSQPFPPNDIISDLNISQCEQILRQQYNLAQDEEIIIAKIDYVNDTTNINQVEYKIYTTNGIELDLAYCEDIPVTVSYPLFDVKNELDFAMMETLLAKGINMFDTNDDFYNDICKPFGINERDVLLEDRRKMFYKNVTLCEHNCEYQQIELSQRKVICKCDTKTTYNKHNNITINIQNDFNELPSELNVMVVKCYKLFINWDHFKTSVPYWTFGSLTSISLILCLLCFCEERKKILSLMLSFTKGNLFIPHPPLRSSTNTNNTAIPNTNANSISQQQKDYFEKSTPIQSNSSTKLGIMINRFDKNHNNNYFESEYSDNEYTEKPNSKIEISYPKAPSILSSSDTFDINNNTKFTTSKLASLSKFKQISEETITESSSPTSSEHPIKLSSHKDNYPFLLAYQQDTRSSCNLFFHFFTKKIPLIRALSKHSSFEMVSANLALYTLYVDILFIMNTLLFEKAFIKERFVEGEISLTKQLLHSSLSMVIVFVIMKVIRKIANVSRILETVFVEVRDVNEFLRVARKAYKRTKRRLAWLFVAEVVLTAVCWYYVGLFAMVYENTQRSWGYSVGLSLGVGYAVVLLVSGVIAVLRRRGIVTCSKGLYNVALWIDWFIW